MNSSWDDDAINAYELAMPGYEIIGVTGSWESTDALHCRVKGIPDLDMLQLFHNPLRDTVNLFINEGYMINAVIDDLSKKIMNDSIKIFNLCKKNDINALMTPTNIKSGTDRVYKAYKTLKKKYIYSNVIKKKTYNKYKKKKKKNNNKKKIKKK